MTAREYAKECGIELVGKLTKKVIAHERFDLLKGEMVTKKDTYWIDEAGNELEKGKNGNWCLTTADGTVY